MYRNENSKKVGIVTTCVVILVCLILVTGSTFSLFTSQSGANIAITSGKVEMVAVINADTLALYSKGVAQDEKFENGGIAAFNSDKTELTLTYITPGDKVEFDIDVENKSNVDIMYRVNWVVDGDLASALTATVDGEALVSGSTEWTLWKADATEKSKTLAVSIELPLEADDNWQSLTANIAFSVEAVQGNADIIDTWDGTDDISWLTDALTEDPTTTEFTIDTAEGLVGLCKIVDGTATIPAELASVIPTSMEGYTITLESDLDLYAEDENGNPICFEPIGSYRKETPFKGTFDGQGHTIKNLNQNTWALDNGYSYGDLGLGLFGMVEDATIKNLNMDGASISGESALVGIVAGTAYGNCTFENITVTNSKGNDYQYYAGGVVGWASGTHVYKGIVVDESTTIGSQWGDFGNANGGIIGGASTSGSYHFEDCTVACRIDATNDIVSAYQWYCYRNSGMLIGKVDNYVADEVTNVVAENVTCKNVTVIYNDWANYTYCEFAGTGYPYVRVQAGVSVEAYSNVRYGHPTDANGNVVVDDNHVHNDGEDHHLLLVFDQLFGGPANHRYCYYGVATHDGVTVIYNNK